jgi:ribosomal protein S18 acetylase RimI-like enzyme
VSVLVENKVSLRRAVPEDDEFLARLYFDTRRREVAAWGWPEPQQEMFLRMQFDAQRRSYRAAFPNAVDSIVSLDDAPVGHMLVGDEPGSMRLIDIALLEDYRNRGIGTGLLRRQMEECEALGRTLRLQVLHTNPAVRLYERLGFLKTDADAMYAQMEWTQKPGGSR